MRRKLLGMALALAGGAVAAAPNVLFIVTDDQRPDTVGAGLTPVVDRLAAGGTRFTRAYAGYPICHASRAEMLTGRPAFTALRNYPAGGLDPAHRTLAEVFREAGYETWHLGKWHVNGKPEEQGYERTRRQFSSGGAGKGGLPAVDERGLPLTGYRGWTFKTESGEPEAGMGVGLTGVTDARIADGAVEVIRELRDKTRPFFLHVNFTAPHDPRLWPAGEKAGKKEERPALPGNFRAEHPFDHGNRGGRDETLIPRPLDAEQVRAELEVYRALVRNLDRQTGRLLEALEAAGVREETLVVFTSDQGLAMGSHGLMGKQNQYEHSIRAPLVLAGPGVPRGVETAGLCHLRDLFPTLCELCGVPVPDTVTARSLMPLARGEVKAAREVVTGAFTDTQRMLCDGRWKWIEYPQAGRAQLFDLEADPEELGDLSGDPAQAERAAAMARRLRAELKALGDPLEMK